jgi:hypothetical protein
VFDLHVVTDNTNLEHDPARRIRWRLERDPLGNIGEADVTTQIADFNGIADVYTYRFTGALPGDIIRLALHSRVAGEAAGYGGLMFDVIPEPVSLTIWGVGALGLIGFARRRR